MFEPRLWGPRCVRNAASCEHSLTVVGGKKNRPINTVLSPSCDGGYRYLSFSSANY